MREGRLEKEEAGRGRAMVLLVLTALFWSFGGILIKWIRWNPMAISGMRSAIAALTILIVFRGLRITWSRDQVGGAVAYAGTVTFFVLATKLTTAANAILLQYTAPIHVALFGPWFLGEHSRRRDTLSIVILLAGMSLFFFDQLSPAGFWGNISALASGFCFGWLTLFLRRQKGGSGIESIFLGNLLAAAIGLPFMFGEMPDLHGWVGLLLLGTVQMGIPYVLFSIAVRHVPAVTAILVPMIEPVLNPVWVLLLLGESPTPLAVGGGAVILGTVAARCIADFSRFHRAGRPL